MKYYPGDKHRTLSFAGGLLALIVGLLACTFTPATAPTPVLPTPIFEEGNRQLPTGARAIVPTVEITPIDDSAAPQEDDPTVVLPSPSIEPENTPAPVETSSTYRLLLPVIARMPVSASKNQTLASSPAYPLQLGFLQQGDVWLAEFSAGTFTPTLRQITQNGRLVSFVWSVDGEKLAAFDGRRVCFWNMNDNPPAPCVDLGLDDTQAAVSRKLAWSPDEKTMVIWNSTSAAGEGVIGWIVLALDGSEKALMIEDPIDWGASLAPENEPGGFTGQPVFLPDGRLIGSLSHRYLCTSGGCQYRLYQFDLAAEGFEPYPIGSDDLALDGEGLDLSPDHSQLINLGVLQQSCNSYASYVTLAEINGRSLQQFSFPQESFFGLTLAPDATKAYIARGAVCNPVESSNWAVDCGLTDGVDIFSMQAWDLQSDTRSDILPGIEPAWSPSENLLAFRSCLSPSSGQWSINSQGPASIYIMPAGNDLTKIQLVSGGSSLAWRP